MHNIEAERYHNVIATLQAVLNLILLGTVYNQPWFLQSKTNYITSNFTLENSSLSYEIRLLWHKSTNKPKRKSYVIQISLMWTIFQ